MRSLAFSPALLSLLVLGCLEPLRTRSQGSPFCTPRACPAGACGGVDNGCGQPMDCGGCGAGMACSANVCVAGRPAAAIAAGAHHSCAILTTGALRCWGGNQGQLGDGSTTDRLTPVDVVGMNADVAAVAAGAFHTCALRSSSGSVHCFGQNGDGQLGNGTQVASATPVTVSGELTTQVVRIGAGGNHSCAIQSDGRMLCWGLSADGQLGTGSTASSSTAVDVSGATTYGLGKVAQLALGQSHTCALTQTGAVWCWGADAKGQAGDSSLSARLTSPRAVDSGLSARALTAGALHTCALLASGQVRCFGDNASGQLGAALSYPSTSWGGVEAELPPGVQAVSSHLSHTCALTSGGEVYCWGNNDKGQLGDHQTLWNRVPQRIRSLPAGIRAIAAGGSHACALTSDGLVYCWGSNAYGQLGNGTRADSTAPVAVVGL